ncbi:allantoinase AllB [Cohnella lubricantis]|uniref:Allantoinase n=1 Tax=Cohnella lubricantis TaxID=2163172 RepID=A0A841TAA7_9BACL|nr:allantoinase AllB [Cohnella lubricantis]MBB6676996.1 allantoinase AllB [Cohnella lubricantis]MBP2117054.1 allantoinase [Cohnella lubricantis]
MGERFDRIIRGGQVVAQEEVRVLDIGMKDGKIAALAERLEASEETSVLDARGRWVLPGMVDVHVHFNEPNRGHWEGFATGSAALAAGGATCYVDMPLNGLPPTVNVPALRQKEALAEGTSVVDYAFWGGLVPGNLGDLEPLAAEGVPAFKAFLSNPGGEGEERFREVDDVSLLEGMKRIASFGGLLALHAESDAITSALAEAAAREGRTGPLDFVRTRPVIAELEAVNRAILFSEQTGCRLHFVHMSSPEAIDLIDQAKRRGVDVTVETCPHYLALSELDLERLGAVAKCAPPLRDEARIARMWEQLAEGKIDVIASDHSPSPEELKLAPGLSFMQAWGGIAGAQSSLELMLHEGHIVRGIPLPKLAAVLSANPAKRFGLYPRKGEIAVGFDADVAIVDPEASYILSKEDLLQKHPISPYVGRTFSCRVAMTLVRGSVVYEAGSGIQLSGHGIQLRAGALGSVVL